MDARCSCGQLRSQHTRDGGGCAECRCPGWTDDWSPVPALINEHADWPLLLPPYRAYRKSWAWHEAARLAALHEAIRPGDMVYEIGAEEGDYAALFMSWGAKVAIVEPNPKAWPSIKASFDANGLAPHAWMLGFVADHEWTTDTNRAVQFGRSGWPEAADGDLIPEHGFHAIWEHAWVTPAVTLDKFAAKVGTPPDVISIDVEGAELHVLRGGTKTLTEHRPVVFVSVHHEFMHDLYDLDSASVHELMADYGYEGTHLATDHEQHWMWRHAQGRKL